MYYKVTLTTSGGFTVEQVKGFQEIFDQLQFAYVTNEFGTSGGNSHLEGVIERDTIKANNVTVWIKSLYKTLGIEVTPNSIRVKTVTHLVGAIIYTNKEVKDIQSKAEVVSLRGWTQSWIDQTVKDNVKNISFKELKKRGVKFTQGTGGALMFEWCKANNMQVTRKSEYLSVVKEMAKQGFMFGSIRHVGLYQDVCALFGDGNAACDAAENALAFLP